MPEQLDASRPGCSALDDFAQRARSDDPQLTVAERREGVEQLENAFSLDQLADEEEPDAQWPIAISRRVTRGKSSDIGHSHDTA
jgi:hypothetical protein